MSGPSPSERSAAPPVPVLMLGLHWFPADRTGLNRYFFDLLRSSTEGSATRAVVVGPAPDPPPYLHVAGSLAERLPVRLARYARAAGRAAPGARLVDGHFALFTAAALTRRSVRALPLVVHFQGPWADESEAGGTSGDPAVRAKRRLERAVYRRAHRLVVLSTAFKRILVEQYGVSPWRVEVIVPGVDTDRFTPGERAAARAALGLPGDGFIAVTTRRLVRRTGVDVLLDAWAKLDGTQSALLVVTGAGPERQALEERAAQAGLGDRVRFLGEVSEADLVLAYRAADVSVVPSRGLEGFGLVVLESLACGTPAIGTEAGGLGEAIALLDPGLVVPSDDAGALAAQLERAIADPGALPAAERCRAVAEEHTWALVAGAHARLHERVVQPGERTTPRVVYLDHTAQISGAEVSLARLLPAIGDVETHVVLATDGPLVSLLTRSGCSTQVLPLREASRGLSREAVSIRHPPLRSALATVGYVARLTRQLRRLEPDIVHTNSLKAALYGGVAGRLARVPVVWQVNDRVADDYLPRFAVRLMRAAGSRLPHHVIVNSEATAATLPVHRPVTVIPHPIPVSPPGPGPRPYRPGSGLRVGIVGRLSPWKGQDVFLRGFAAAFPDGDATAVIVGAALFGEDEIEPGLRALAAELGIAERVEMLGHRDDVPEVMAGLDILVHASVIPEPFGMVVGEGMALGLPVVAADAAGPAEIIDHGVNGLLYRMGDPADLAAALRSLADDEGLRRQLGAAGRLRSADFSPAVVAAAVRGVYASVLSGRALRPSRRPRRGR